MRISDWSSDVCSSDLHAVGERQARRIVHGVAGHRRLNLVIDVADQDQFVDALADVDADAVVPVGRGFIGDVGIRSERRSVGNGEVSTVRLRWSTYISQKNK